MGVGSFFKGRDGSVLFVHQQFPLNFDSEKPNVRKFWIGSRKQQVNLRREINNEVEQTAKLTLDGGSPSEIIGFRAADISRRGLEVCKLRNSSLYYEFEANVRARLSFQRVAELHRARGIRMGSFS